MVQLLSVLGIGALIGAIIQQSAQFYLSWLQHKRELNLRRFDAEQRRRDDRMVRLRQDLKELMYALFEVEKALSLFHAGHARAAGEPKSREALENIDRLTERREAARAGLLLDPDGKRLYEVFQGLLSKVNNAQAEARYVQTVFEARGVGDELNQRIDEFRESTEAIRKDMDATIQQAQDLLAVIADPR